MSSQTRQEIFLTDPPRTSLSSRNSILEPSEGNSREKGKNKGKRLAKQMETIRKKKANMTGTHMTGVIGGIMEVNNGKKTTPKIRNRELNTTNIHYATSPIRGGEETRS